MPKNKRLFRDLLYIRFSWDCNARDTDNATYHRDTLVTSKRRCGVDGASRNIRNERMEDERSLSNEDYDHRPSMPTHLTDGRRPRKPLLDPTTVKRDVSL